MTRREEQAYNDGKMAFADGRPLSFCSRRSPDQRAAWLKGFEDERRLRASMAATPEQLAEARAALGKLKDWAKSL